MLLFVGGASICQQPVRQVVVTDGDTPEIDGIRVNPLAGEAGLTDGRIKTEFDTREGAESGAIALKRRFPDLQVRVYDASTKSRHEVQA